MQGSPLCQGNSGHWDIDVWDVKLPYLIWLCPKGPFEMEDIYYLKGNGNKCFHEQSQEGAIDLEKRKETSDRPDLLCLMDAETPWTRLRDSYFCERKHHTLRRILIQNILAEGF